MNDSYKRPLPEYRLVKSPIYEWNGIAGPGATKRVTGYEYTLQRKWQVFDVLTSDTSKHFVGTVDNKEINGVVGRDEWRDCETVLEDGE